MRQPLHDGFELPRDGLLLPISIGELDGEM